MRKRSLVAAVLGAVALIGSILVATPAHALNDTGTGGVFIPTTGRILDTKAGTGGFSTPMEAGAYRTIKVAGLAGLPSDGSVGAVSLNATVAASSGAGTLFGRPDASSGRTTMLIYNGVSGQYTSNSATIAVGSDGTIQVMTETSARLILDVQGYYTANTDGTASGGFVPVAKRIVDTRAGLGATKATIAAGGSIDVQVAGSNGVPTGASGVVVNLLAINSTASDGYLTPYATGGTKPQNALHYAPSITTAVQAQVPLSSDGKITIANGSSTVNLVIDLQGYFATTGADGAVFTPSYGRAYDSRASGNTALAKSETRSIQIAGKAGVPVMGSGITAVTLSLIVSHPGSAGYAQVYADGTGNPGTTALNFQTDDIRTNTITVPLGANGKIALRNVADASDYVVDVQGWYAAPTTAAIACSGYSAGSWTAVVPDTVSCTVSSPASTGSGMYAEITTPDGFQTVSLDPSAPSVLTTRFHPAAGENEVDATVYDVDDNVVSDNLYTLGFGDWSAKPLVTDPSPGASVMASTILSVAPAEGSVFLDAVQYTFAVAADASMDSPLWSTTSATPSALIPRGTLADDNSYYWTVTASGPTNWSGGSGSLTSSPQLIVTDAVAVPLTADQDAQVRANMQDLSIDQSTQNDLIAKLNAGTPVDSSVPGAQPVQTITSGDAAATTTLVYADGSRSQQTLENPANTASGQGVHIMTSKSGCQKSDGWYVNCKIGIADLISHAYFIIDYKTSKSKKAQVRDMRAKTCAGLWATTNCSGSIKRGTQSSKGPAWAEETYHYSSPYGVVQGGSAFGLRVSGTSALTY